MDLLSQRNELEDLSEGLSVKGAVQGCNQDYLAHIAKELDLLGDVEEELAFVYSYHIEFFNDGCHIFKFVKLQSLQFLSIERFALINESTKDLLIVSGDEALVGISVVIGIIHNETTLFGDLVTFNLAQKLGALA